MKAFVAEIKGEASEIVSSTNSAKAVKSGLLDVYATPSMIALMECATCKAVEPLLEDGETTVGTKIDVAHIKASGINKNITAVATLKEVDSRRLVFDVEAHEDNGDIIGKGSIERFVVNAERFMKKVEA